MTERDDKGNRAAVLNLRSSIFKVNLPFCPDLVLLKVTVTSKFEKTSQNGYPNLHTN